MQCLAFRPANVYSSCCWSLNSCHLANTRQAVMWHLSGRWLRSSHSVPWGNDGWSAANRAVAPVQVVSRTSVVALLVSALKAASGRNAQRRRMITWTLHRKFKLKPRCICDPLTNDCKKKKNPWSIPEGGFWVFVVLSHSNYSQNI